MIRTEDAIRVARSLLGTPYSELDCINLIKRIIRTAPGGVRGYTTAGTNTLWKSAKASAKYRDLTWTQEGIAGAWAGMLAFKRHGGDVHHVGLVTERGTVIHSSSARGQVVETALDASWHLLAVHRYIEAEGARSAGPEGSGGISISPLDPSGLPYPLETTGAAATGPRGEGDGGTEGGDGMAVMFRARVVTKSGPLNLRDEPGPGGSKTGSLPRGAVVDVLDTAINAGWWHVQYGALDGYASSDYLERIEGMRSAGPEGSGGISISDRNSHPLDGDSFSDATFRLPESATGGGRLQSPLDPSGLPYPLETTGAAAPGPRGEGDGRTDEGTSLEATTLVREDGDGVVTLIGRWRVAED